MKKLLLVMVPLLVFVMGSTSMQEKKAAGAKKEEAKVTYQYVGVKSCKMCHKSEKSGEQFRIWSEGPHAKAYATLGTEAAAAVAKEQGIKVPPQEAPECLGCHATAYGLKKDQIKGTLKLEDGVQCESCHGPGSAYKKMATMKDHAKSVAAGMWEASEEICVKCHNKKSPTYKEFVFKTKIAKVSHPTPAPAAEGK